MRFIDLSHVVEPGMTTYKGLPGPHVCDYLGREEARGLYEDGESFLIQRVEMVGNTSTYVDSPFHRYAEGDDLAGLRLEQLAHLEAVVVRRPFEGGLAVDADAFETLELTGKAVLVHTGWDRHWRTDAYQTGHPFLTEAAARLLVERGAALVGIDSHNIDDTRTMRRPVHSALLGAGIPICEHMTNLAALPATAVRFHAVPPKMAGVGTFPVRAYAVVVER